MTRQEQSLGALVVTLSASYGAGGSVVGPALAERLGLPFYDRLLHGPETHDPEHILERLTEEERKQRPPGSVVSNLGHMSSVFGFSTQAAADLDPRPRLRDEVAANVRGIAHRPEGGVILGRSAAAVLGKTGTAFHVRLDGPADRRLAQGMRIEGISEDVARAHQTDADRAWTTFTKRVFGRDPTDGQLYHLMVDSTVVPLPACVSLIADAASAAMLAAAADA
jgi:cytidylate kinase